MSLGKRYRDEITGFSGVATARTIYLHGPSSVCLETMIDGCPVDEWFSESRLELVDEDDVP